MQMASPVRDWQNGSGGPLSGAASGATPLSRPPDVLVPEEPLEELELEPPPSPEELPVPLAPLLDPPLELVLGASFASEEQATSATSASEAKVEAMSTLLPRSGPSGLRVTPEA